MGGAGFESARDEWMSGLMEAFKHRIRAHNRDPTSHAIVLVSSPCKLPYSPLLKSTRTPLECSNLQHLPS